MLTSSYKSDKIMADKIKELEKKLKEQRDYTDSLNYRLNEGRHYLMSVQSDEITVGDALEAFGFNRNGLRG